MKKTLPFIILISTIVLSACGLKAEAPMEAGDYYADNSAEGMVLGLPESQSAPAPSVEMDRNSIKTDAVSYETQDRMVIQNADLTIVVSDPESKLSTISAMTVELGGFVVSSNQYQNYRSNGLPVPEGSITIRIPAEKLDQALERIKSDAVEVRNENRSGQDVTQEYIDLNSQLRSLETAVTQLEKIMEAALETDDVLDVFSQLQYYNQQIDVIKGRIQYFEQASALSAINITLIAEATIQPIEIGGWKPVGVARDAIQKLVEFWQGFVDFLINFFLLVLPVLITIGIPLFLVYLIVRALLRKRRARKANTQKE